MTSERRKIRYFTREEALDALADCIMERAFGNAKRREANIYFNDGSYFLTSQERREEGLTFTLSNSQAQIIMTNCRKQIKAIEAKMKPLFLMLHNNDDRVIRIRLMKLQKKKESQQKIFDTLKRQIKEQKKK